MSFWSSVTTTVSSAAASAKAQAEKTYADLTAAPTSVPCDGCDKELPVPADAWAWRCALETCNTANGREHAECRQCKARKPNVNKPVVVCDACNVKTEVPWTVAQRGLKTAAKDTRAFAIQSYDSAKKDIAYLKSKPAQFNCEHCSTLLAVPPPLPWSCPKCTAINNGPAEQCAGCQQAKPPMNAAGAAMVVCGMCANPTKIPTSNFENKVKSGLTEVAAVSKKLLFDVTSTPYIHCPRCSTPIKLTVRPKRSQEQIQQAAQHSAQQAEQKDDSVRLLQPQAEIQVQMEGQTVPSNVNVSVALPPTASDGGAAQPLTEEKSCDKCKERLLVPVIEREDKKKPSA